MTIDEFEQKMEQIKLEKEKCVRSQRYVDAARLRDRYRVLMSIYYDEIYPNIVATIRGLNRERQIENILTDTDLPYLQLEDMDEFKKLVEKYGPIGTI